MSDTVTVGTPQVLIGEVGFRRTVQVRQYETKEALVKLQFSYPETASEADLVAAAEEVLKNAEAIVLSNLGLDGLDDGPSPEQVAAASPAAAIDAVSWPEPFFTGRDGKPKVSNDFKAWAKRRFETHPDEFYDNRGDNYPNIVHKKTRAKVYMD